MSDSINDWILKFNETLEYAKWNKDLAEEIQDYLNGQNYSSKAIDKLLMAISKLVETNLRDSVQIFTGATVPKGKGYGVALLNYAKTTGLIPEPKRGTDCLYSLIYWYMNKLRNTSHHVFTNFPLPTLLLFASTANYVLEEIDRLSKGNEVYNAKIIVHSIRDYKVSVTVDDIIKGSESAEIPNLEIHLSAPDKSIKTIPLNREGSKWKTVFTTYGYLNGTYRIDLSGYTDGGKKISISGSTILLL